jgi:hypothetical protein
MPLQVFKAPVQWEKIGLLDYPNVVKNPMDLGTIGKKLEHLECASHPAGSCSPVHSGCNPIHQRLQPHAPEAATPCTRGCNPMHQRLQPHARRYANLEELWADINLMFDNAKLFNGPDSWVTKHEVRLRALLKKKTNPNPQP